eukprot:TRINITY_DN6481_c0_g1_i2.p1 TRINITY_DN6481_c0_g1~~TRINITY_DN6481_c0_g1_i2.p1  ORF type:complete len:114 (-),score=7.16 TRINITY_DN6481_c0_g1_i2:70-411(-)
MLDRVEHLVTLEGTCRAFRQIVRNSGCWEKLYWERFDYFPIKRTDNEIIERMDWKVFFRMQDREDISQHFITRDIFCVDFPYWSRSRNNKEKKLRDLAEKVLHFQVPKRVLIS